MKINSKHSVEQYSNFNLKDFFGMNSPKKLLTKVSHPNK